MIASRLRWPRVVVGVVGVVVVGFVAAVVVGSVGRVEPATWQLDGSFAAQVSRMRIPILVFEAACSSGAPTTGRMDVDVAYMRDVVTIDV